MDILLDLEVRKSSLNQRFQYFENHLKLPLIVAVEGLAKFRVSLALIHLNLQVVEEDLLSKVGLCFEILNLSVVFGGRCILLPECVILLE